MNYFVCTYAYGPAEEQAKFRPDHRAYLGTLVKQGKIAASGPFVTEENPGALIIFSVESEQDVHELVAADPMKIGGAVLNYSVQQWNPVLGTVGA